jgi:hypothetical protein
VKIWLERLWKINTQYLTGIHETLFLRTMGNPKSNVK